MSTADERIKIVQEIDELTTKVEEIESNIKENFYIGKTLESSTFQWNNVSMMNDLNNIDSSIDMSITRLNAAVYDLSSSIKKLRSMIEELE